MEKPSYKGENPFKKAVRQVIEIEKEDYIMEKNEIKKALYKQKPIAKIFDRETTDENKGNGYYYTHIKTNGDNNIVRVFFEIPSDEIKNEDGVNIFKDEEPAQLLIRWLVV